MAVAKNSRLTLVCILVTILLDMIGLGIIVPVLPELIEQLTGSGLARSAVEGGYLVFVYALMQFLFSPVLGYLSDRYGRRPVLLLSLVGLTIDYSLMGFAPVIGYIYFGRLLSGISGAAVATATAYITDISTPDKRAQRFGLIGAAFGLGFIIGPVIGGELGQIFGAARARFTPPRASPPRTSCSVSSYCRKACPRTAAGISIFIFAGLLQPAVRRAGVPAVPLPGCPVVACSGCSCCRCWPARLSPSVWNFFTIEVVNFSSAQIGRSLGAFGIGFAISQAFLIGPLVKRFGEWTTVPFLPGSAAAAVAFTGTAFIHTQVGLLRVPDGRRVVGARRARHQQPVVAAGAGQSAGANFRGARSTLPIHWRRSLGRWSRRSSFLIFTIADKGQPGYFPGAPFVGAGITVVLSGIVFIYTAWRYDLMHRPSVATRPHRPDMAPPGQQATPPYDEPIDAESK